jgi:hypothetical protein
MRGSRRQAAHDLPRRTAACRRSSPRPGHHRARHGHAGTPAPGTTGPAKPPAGPRTPPRPPTRTRRPPAPSGTRAATRELPQGLQRRNLRNRPAVPSPARRSAYRIAVYRADSIGCLSTFMWKWGIGRPRGWTAARATGGAAFAWPSAGGATGAPAAVHQGRRRLVHGSDVAWIGRRHGRRAD